MIEDERAWNRGIAEALYVLLLGLTLTIAFVLAGIYLTTPPMVPIEFVKLHWDLYAGLVVGVGTLSYAHRKLWGKR